jgi:hypothetical protein
LIKLTLGLAALCAATIVPALPAHSAGTFSIGVWGNGLIITDGGGNSLSARNGNGIILTDSKPTFTIKAQCKDPVISPFG